MVDISNLQNTRDAYVKETPERHKITDNHNYSKVDKSTKSGLSFSKILGKENTKINHNAAPNSTSEYQNLSNNNISRDVMGQDGTNLARMQEVAKELTDQLYGFLWASMAEEVNKTPEGGFGEEMFKKSLWPELIKVSRGTQRDELQEAIVRDLIRSEARTGK